MRDNLLRTLRGTNDPATVTTIQSFDMSELYPSGHQTGL